MKFIAALLVAHKHLAQQYGHVISYREITPHYLIRTSNFWGLRFGALPGDSNYHSSGTLVKESW